MSLINNMLKDLEQRQAVQACAPAGVLDDLAPSTHRSHSKPSRVIFYMAGILAIVLILAMLLPWEPEVVAPVAMNEQRPLLKDATANGLLVPAPMPGAPASFASTTDNIIVDPEISTEPSRIIGIDLDKKSDRAGLVISLSKPLANKPLLTIERGEAIIKLTGVDLGQKPAFPPNTSTYYKNIYLRQDNEFTVISFATSDGSHTDVRVTDGNGVQRIHINYRPVPVAPTIANPESKPRTVIPAAHVTETRSKPEPTAEPSVVIRKTKKYSAQEKALIEYHTGTAALQKGNPYLAEEKLRAAVKLDPDLIPATQALAALLINDQRNPEAENLIRRGLLRRTGEPAYTSLYARILIQRDDLEGAVQMLESGLIQAGNDAEYHALLATTYQRLAQYPKAIQHYQHALGLKADHGVWLTGLAVSLEGDGKPDTALSAYQAALRSPVLNQTLKNYALERIEALHKANP